ncbi:hypothetical protein [Paenibacillus arenosi]|nr:hypothetical protein [Paenibacillus arenosi]
MKRKLLKAPILLVLTLLSVGFIHTDDMITPFGGGVPWIIDK